MARDQLTSAETKPTLSISLTIPWAIFKRLYLCFVKSSETPKQFSPGFFLPFAIFKSPWSISVNILFVSPWLELDNDRFHCQAQTFILTRLTYTMHPIYLRFLIRQTNFTKISLKIFEISFWLSFLSYFKPCIRRQYELLHCSLSSHFIPSFSIFFSWRPIFSSKSTIF